MNFLGRNKITASDLKELKELEGKIIELLPDDFQKKVFGILSKHNFDLVEFLEGDWREPLISMYRDISFYLDPKHPLNYVGEKLPVAGRDFLFWMLQQAKIGSNSDNRYINIAEAIKRGDICGHKISDQRTIEQILSIAGVVFFSREYGLQFKTMMEIMCDLEEGETFIKNELFNKVSPSLFY